MPCLAQGTLAKGETEKIAEEAFIDGFPLVMNYGVFDEYFVDKSGKEYKAPPNQLYNTARVYIPQDTAIVTPNSDTPYSFVAMDLRASRSWSAIPRSRSRGISRCSSSTCTRSTSGTWEAAPPATGPPVT